MWATHGDKWFAFSLNTPATIANTVSISTVHYFLHTDLETAVNCWQKGFEVSDWSRHLSANQKQVSTPTYPMSCQFICKAKARNNFNSFFLVLCLTTSVLVTDCSFPCSNALQCAVKSPTGSDCWVYCMRSEIQCTVLLFHTVSLHTVHDNLLC